MSKRRDILEALKTKLETVTVVNGFLTGAGANVHLGEVPVYGPDDADEALVIVVGDDQVLSQTFDGAVEIALPLLIVGTLPATLSDPHDKIEDLIDDIKTAVETVWWTAGDVGSIVRGSTQFLERSEGHTAVGASVSYEIVFDETWGSP